MSLGTSRQVASECQRRDFGLVEGHLKNLRNPLSLFLYRSS